MLRMIAILFGIAFIFAGVAGFLPAFIENNLLFGYFEVNNVHNIVHIVTGVLAIMCATSVSTTVWFFKLFGLIYTFAAIWGFWNNGDLYVMHVNTADNILHIVVGVIALLLGFKNRSKKAY